MGAVKEFAIQLSEYVFIWHMSDEAIINLFISPISNEEEYEIKAWLLNQLQHIRNNPDIYQQMVEH